MRFFKKTAKQKDQPVNVQQSPADELPKDINDPEFLELYKLCKPYTMTTVERLYALYNAVRYVLDKNIEGDFVECGVWKGGSSMMMAALLAKAGVTNRKIILYDTYEGMSEPTEADKDSTGETAAQLLQQQAKEDAASVWCYSSFDEVKSNLQKAGLPEDNIIMIQGKVEDTIPENIPAQKIALLRLDTDWYESTKHELIHLYPLLTANGILIIDD
ncbi:MAG: macrocin O-methyltransferase, partial [Chitinophagaceae bacterium]